MVKQGSIQDFLLGMGMGCTNNTLVSFAISARIVL